MYIYVGVLSCGGGQGLGTQESRGREAGGRNSKKGGKWEK